MQFTISTIIAAAAFLLPTALAQTASVVNECSYSAYVYTNGNTVQLSANGGSYSQPMNSAGNAIVLATDSGLSNPLTFEYSVVGSQNYYDLSNNSGNPWAGEEVALTASDSGCYSFDCAANDSSCYSNGSAPKVQECESGTNLAVTLCGGPGSTAAPTSVAPPAPTSTMPSTPAMTCACQ